MPPELSEAPDCPDDFLHVWLWFTELRAAQGSNGFELSPITWTELNSWCIRTGNEPTFIETDLLMQADRVFRREIADRPVDTPKSKPRGRNR